MATYTSIHLAERPTSLIVPGKTFTTKTQPLPSASSLKDGEVLFQTLYLSLDPAMRGWLNDKRSYIPPVQIGEKMRGVGIGIVKASKSSAFHVGTFASGMCGWAEYAVVPEKALQALDLPRGTVPTDALGVLGMTGLTAYFGILDVGKVKEGDFVVVSGAAGATGSVVVQIAKLKGAKVLGLAGGEDKCRWLKEELGADEALNYKDPEFKNKFREATKTFIDVFFDNVGGEILDLALTRAKPHARFVMCGAISQYNSTAPYGLKNYMSIISMRIRMEGFIIFDYEKQFPQARQQLAQWLVEGTLKRKETIVKGGLAKAEETLLGLFQGANTGKLLVEVATPEDVQGKL
ncbi:NADP-dependent leukotriene B4 12-hydroxydehydrogenase [Lentithecium fluviatile CBS 122367]|uniref:NADP-dependent leukotriene B4 12-hydroxydehydrogenase n=1 Tax=Lentithecium fluviatile CBS 122367 TaxID=1168545 RepID=A0A6G1IWB6_9PLEO|nr:NADP-dependent leukotriene B4 12-hydroxydehydrogenase [Lentithecium fluviatile CBS 122367]